MTPGARYALVLRFEPFLQKEPNYFLYDPMSEPWCASVWPLEGEPDDYLETEKFAPLRELTEITDADAHTFDVVYTQDMSSILRFAKDETVILKGRALTPEDSDARSNVCVVSASFATANDLGVGDSLTLKLGSELFEQYKGLGAVAATRERYAPAETEATLEIVGVYIDLDSPNRQAASANLCYSVNTIFVPKTLLPIEEASLAEHKFAPGEFSFTVENAWDIPAFVKESESVFEKTGLKLIFFDDGWTAIAREFRAVQTLAVIKIAVLSAATVAATGFVVHLFIGRKKKEYAVMRALGTNRRASAKALLVPLMTVAVSSVLAGSGAAWVYTVKTIAESNALARLEVFTVSTALPKGAAIGCVLGEILLTLVIALALLRRTGALAPLALLQDNASANTRSVNKSLMHTPSQTAPVASLTLSASAADAPTLPVTPRRRRSFSLVLRYILRHMRRTAGKSALAVTLAALLLGTIGTVAAMKRQYVELCDGTVVKANFIGLSLSLIPSVTENDFVENPYYESSLTAEMNLDDARIVITNNIARYADETAEVVYADGYDASCMERFGELVVIGRELADIYRLELGGTVSLARQGTFSQLRNETIAVYKMEHPSESITDDEILALKYDALQLSIDRKTHPYTIAGIVTTPSGAYDRVVFTPGSDKASVNLGAPAALDMAEFELADYTRLEDFRKFGERLSGGNQLGGVAFVFDSEKLESLLGTLRLIDTLYPIAVAAALLIGGFCCCLVIAQSSKEAAIMRVLGTTKRITRAMLASEQILLSVGGLFIGLCGLLIYKRAELSAIAGGISLFAALYLAVIAASAVFSAAAATRRNILELLQTKE
jgi:hypothetical protein